MPFNLTRVYNDILEIAAMNEGQRNRSLRGVFNKDFINVQGIAFRNKPITPTPVDGVIEMETLFRHLTTKMISPASRQREFDYERSIRLHWVRHHIDERKLTGVLVFSLEEPEGRRTYIYDVDEKYVVVLEPKYNNTIYFLITAYRVLGRDAQRDKIMRKYARRLNDIL